MVIPQDWELQGDGTYINMYGDRYDRNGKRIPFTKNGTPHPGSRKDSETLRQYRSRVDISIKKGFHPGDLSWGQYEDYCNASNE